MNKGAPNRFLDRKYGSEAWLGNTKAVSYLTEPRIFLNSKCKNNQIPVYLLPLTAYNSGLSVALFSLGPEPPSKAEPFYRMAL